MRVPGEEELKGLETLDVDTQGKEDWPRKLARPR